MTASYHNEYRFQVSLETVTRVRAMATPSASFSWVGSSAHGCRLRIHTWRGVPGKHCDVLIADSPYLIEGRPKEFIHHRTGEVLAEPRAWLLVCDVGRKEGRYDGSVRWRITLRDLEPALDPQRDPPRGRLSIEEDDGELHVVATWRGGMWGQAFPQLRYEISPDSDLPAILIRQALLYFPFLCNRAWEREARQRESGNAVDDQVRALAASWASLPDVRAMTDVNQLNRDASQALYQMARQSGWVKLTLSQRERIGLSADSAQWQREERVAALRQQAGLGTVQGVGRHTIDAANGAVITLPRGICAQCQELDEDCDCMT